MKEASRTYAEGRGNMDGGGIIYESEINALFIRKKGELISCGLLASNRVSPCLPAAYYWTAFCGDCAAKSPSGPSTLTATASAGETVNDAAPGPEAGMRRASLAGKS